MRLAWYAGASTALAAGVVISAFHQRANFYSAMVYLFQSNLCMMILVNLVALVYSSFLYSVQRICFGQLRAIEVEQLYEKAWFAVTETCLAMTIFRDEIGGFFIVMFVALLTGKVWGWIGEGRIEALEQQPPANPRLFHTRLIISLLLSLVYGSSLLYYAVKTVIEQARPDMMVMFLFEFAVLLVTSLHTALRYSIILLDTRIIKKQTQERLQERRSQVREERADILRRREAGEPDDGEPLPDEDDVDEMDIEVPGWEAKGQYVLGLDLWTDFTKLCIYAVFFFVLLSFYGLPLHIIRDLFMTVRSFVKRLGALMKYRQAIRDMSKYADATEEELGRENTCIICREDMHVWNPNNPTSIERTRPKKLPCGHILHLGCLKSWMERQQVCPTCRRSVVINDTPQRNGDAVMFRIGLNLRGGEAPDGGAAAAGGGANVPPNQGFPPVNGQAPAAVVGQDIDVNNHNQQPPAGNNGGGLRMFNFGPFRLGFAQGGARDIQEMAQRLGVPAAMAGNGANNNFVPPEAVAGHAAPNNPGTPMIPMYDAAAGAPIAFNLPAGLAQHRLPVTSMYPSSSTSPESIFADLGVIERRIEQGTLELQLASAEARTLRLMMLELQRIRQGQADMATAVQVSTLSVPTSAPSAAQAHHSEQTGVARREGEIPPAQPAQQPAPQPPQAAQGPPPMHLTTPNQPQVIFHQTQVSGQPPAPPVGISRAPQPQAGFGQYGQRANTPTSADHLTPDRNLPAIPSGSSELPAGVQIPAGWSLLPLQRFDSSALDALNSGPELIGLRGGSVQQPPTTEATSTLDQPATSNTVINNADAASRRAATTSRSGIQPTTAYGVFEPPLETLPNWGGTAELFGGANEATNASRQEQQSAGEDTHPLTPATEPTA